MFSVNGFLRFLKSSLQSAQLSSRLKDLVLSRHLLLVMLMVVVTMAAKMMSVVIIVKITMMILMMMIATIMKPTANISFKSSGIR